MDILPASDVIETFLAIPLSSDVTEEQKDGNFALSLGLFAIVAAGERAGSEEMTQGIFPLLLGTFSFSLLLGTLKAVADTERTGIFCAHPVLTCVGEEMLDGILSLQVIVDTVEQRTEIDFAATLGREEAVSVCTCLGKEMLDGNLSKDVAQACLVGEDSFSSTDETSLQLDLLDVALSSESEHSITRVHLIFCGRLYIPTLSSDSDSMDASTVSVSAPFSN